MDADFRAWKFCTYPCSDREDVARHAAAIGITQRKRLRAAAGRSTQRLQGKVRIGLIAVEEMLRVEDNTFSVFPKKAAGLLDHPQIFLRCGSENLAHMKIPAFPEDRDHRRICLQKCQAICILPGRTILAARTAKSDERCIF